VTKTCKSCGLVYPISDFYSRVLRKTGKRYYQSECKICYLKRTAKTKADNPERTRSYRDKWRKKNEFRAKAQSGGKGTKAPPWVDWDKMADIYKEANTLSKETGEPYEVDHVIPRKGSNVTGLHVQTNLRIVHRDINRQKGNKCEILSIR
jgi:hypothetical protein